jgi:hypothetical protein
MVGRGGGYFTRLNDFYLPSLRLEGGGGHPVGKGWILLGLQGYQVLYKISIYHGLCIKFLVQPGRPKVYKYSASRSGHARGV